MTESDCPGSVRLCQFDIQFNCFRATLAMYRTRLPEELFDGAYVDVWRENRVAIV